MRREILGAFLKKKNPRKMNTVMQYYYIDTTLIHNTYKSEQKARI